MAGQQHCRMEPALAVNRPTPQTCRSNATGDGRNMPFERELVEQSSLIDLPMSHHDPALSQRLNQRTSCVATTEFFNTISQSPTTTGVGDWGL